MDHPASSARRADAERNHGKILVAAHSAFADPDAPVSMAEVARRAGVGMATLYRNFPSRRELLEALYADEVDAICRAAGTARGETAGGVFQAWLRQFFAFATSKRHIASELLQHTDTSNPVFGDSRARVLEAGGPLLRAAQRSGEMRKDLALEQVLDLLVAIAGIRDDARYLKPMLRVVLDGLRSPA